MGTFESYLKTQNYSHGSVDSHISSSVMILSLSTDDFTQTMDEILHEI